jgi:hypothetical protein
MLRGFLVALEGVDGGLWPPTLPSGNFGNGLDLSPLIGKPLVKR